VNVGMARLLHANYADQARSVVGIVRKTTVRTKAGNGRDGKGKWFLSEIG